MLAALNTTPAWFRELFRRLLAVDVAAQLPGRPLDDVPVLKDDEIRRLMAYASILALSTSGEKEIAYEVATRLAEIAGGRVPGVVAAGDLILSRLGNFPGRLLLRNRYTTDQEHAPEMPPWLALERISREIENSIDGSGGVRIRLTDFQFDLFVALDRFPSLSVSAPTSAGKSFVMGLDLVRRLRKNGPQSIVYLVPTRALIREVTLKVRDSLRKADMDSIPVRTVPFPISPSSAPHGIVYILTQERLLSLLHSPLGVPWITTLIVDEAQGIRDEARGIILQTTVETVLQRFPRVRVYFASPLAKNPDYLLTLFKRTNGSSSITETVSPVSQNLILVSPVDREKTQANFELLIESKRLALGRRDLGFEFRGGICKQRAALARAVTRDDESTILYANRAVDAEELATALVEGLPEPDVIDPDIQECVDFIKSEIHPEYNLIRTLPHGVAFHYGDMPTIVRSRVEDLFKSNQVRFVCCTSTLLQGVNLPARHIVILNPKRGLGKPMQRRDFLNLAGRAGRLQNEFHGNIWCVRPAEWEEKAYEGEPLQEIQSAINVVMGDGGSLVQRVLNGTAARDEIDLGETAFSKIYCDFAA